MQKIKEIIKIGNMEETENYRKNFKSFFKEIFYILLSAFIIVYAPSIPDATYLKAEVQLFA